MKAFLRLIVADFRQFVRDRTALFFTIAFPILFMVIFGLVFSGGGEVSYTLGVVNNDQSERGATIVSVLASMNVFDTTTGEPDALLEDLKEGDIRALVIIPEGLGSATPSDPLDITVYYDPSQTTSSQVILSILRETMNQIDRQVTGQQPVLQLQEQSVQSKELSNIDYLVPGILAMSIMILGLFGSLTLVEWREKKILKRFAATPVSKPTMVVSQVVYRLVLALVQTGIIIAIAYVAFDLEVSGSWLMLLGLVLLGTLTFISMGYLAVSRARTTEGAMPIVQILQFPMLFLSGIFFPVEFFPSFMIPIVEAIPVTYLGDALRQVMVDASPMHAMTTNFAVLGGWLVVCLFLAMRFFKWE